MIDWGCTTTSICSGGRSNSQRASIISRALFIRVAESMVIFSPISQVGWLRASWRVTFSSSSALVWRKGPPDAVRMTRPTSSRLPASSDWKMAECSLSTGRIRRPFSRARRVSMEPDMTSDSLLARARSLPVSRAAMLAGSPAAPEMAATSTSASVSRTSSTSPSSPS